MRKARKGESLGRVGEGDESESGWRLWIADVALWGFGRAPLRLSPAPAGWHQGEREVSTPQHTAYKTERGGGWWGVGGSNQDKTAWNAEIHSHSLCRDLQIHWCNTSIAHSLANAVLSVL